MTMIFVPIRTSTGLNAREAWHTRSRRVRAEREATAWLLRGATRPPIPCSVLLTRCAPSGGLDDDNLTGALKGIRDEVAKWLGIDDRHSAQVRYVYAQCRTAPGVWGVRIEFGEPMSGAQLVLGEADFRLGQ